MEWALLRNASALQFAVRQEASEKRDFQDHAPARSAAELYGRYDRTVGIITMSVLSVIMGMVILRASMRYIGRAVRDRLATSALFGRYFPPAQSQWPPLHLAEELAEREGVPLRKSFVLKLKAEEANLHRIVHDCNSHTWVTVSVMSPLAAMHERRCRRRSHGCFLARRREMMKQRSATVPAISIHHIH